MKWITIKGTHVNTSRIDSFFWKDGKLRVWFISDEDYTVWVDYDQKLYRKLCEDLGVEPVEEE
jgi:hypothetical protein